MQLKNERLERAGLASSGRLDLVRIRCDLAAAAPQGGSEPNLTDAAQRMNVSITLGIQFSPLCPATEQVVSCFWEEILWLNSSS